MAELTEQEQIRRNSLNELKNLGINPYPAALYEVNAKSSEILEKYHKEGFQGSRYRDGKYYRKAAPRVRGYVDPGRSKMADSIQDAIRKCGGRDGMVFGFHHHFRDGDYIVNMVVQAAVDMGLRDITIAASSLGSAHDPIAQYIEDGIVTGIQCIELVCLLGSHRRSGLG